VKRQQQQQQQQQEQQQQQQQQEQQQHQGDRHTAGVKASLCNKKYANIFINKYTVYIYIYLTRLTNNYHHISKITLKKNTP